MKTKILVPTDFSDSSKTALEVAAHIAKESGAKLSLLNAFTVPSKSDFGDVLGVPLFELRGRKMLERTTRNDVKRQLRQFVSESEAADWNWDGHFIIKEGDPKSVILQKIKGQNFGLTVMAKTRTRGKRGFLEENLTCDIVANAKSPVLVIPEGYIMRDINTIVYATDLCHHDFTALNKLCDLARLYNANINLVHVMRYENDNEQERRRSLERLLDSMDYPYKRKDYSILRADSALEGLTRYTEKYNVGMIAMTTHTHTLLKRIFRESFTRLMLLYGEHPLLIFNDVNSSPLSEEKTIVKKAEIVF